MGTEPGFFAALAGTKTLAALITPAVLIMSCASLILSTANRLGRIFDRVTTLKSEAESILAGKHALADERLRYLRAQLHTQSKRAGLIHRSMSALYTALVFFVLSSLVLAITTASFPRFDWLATVLAVLGGIFLFAAAVLLLYESRYNLRFIKGQIAFVELLERKSEESIAITPPGPRVAVRKKPGSRRA